MLLVPFLTLVIDGCASQPGSNQPQINQEALVELGTTLFFDTRLSGDGSISCATCHDPSQAYGDGQALSETYPATEGFRNSKSLLNVAKRTTFFWDGQFQNAELETVTAHMISEKLFLNMNEQLLTERLKQMPEYVAMFENSLGEIPSYEGVLTALSSFQETLNTDVSEVLSEQAQRGKDLFEGKAACSSCHSGPTFSDGLPHQMGVSENVDIFNTPLRHTAFRLYLKDHGVAEYMGVRQDPGHFAVSGQDEHQRAFMTPSLLQVSETGPYMHNGLFSSLREVVEFYNNRGLDLGEEESADLVAYLKSLSGDYPRAVEPESPSYQVDPNWAEVSN